MPVAASSPGTLGLYINSFKKNGGNPTDNASPYKRLLGSDGFGAYASGNKITELCNYITQFGYNYALFYDMTGSAMTATQTSETFLTGTGVGNDILNNVMPRFHTAGAVDRAAVSDINLNQTIAVGAISPWDGISAIKRTVDWNQSVSYDPTLAFTKIVIETEFWNFKYNEAGLMSGIVRTVNSSSGGYSRGEVRADSTPINFSTSGISINDSVEINNEWRQVTGFDTSGNIMYVDRPWDVPTTNQIWRIYEQDGSIDYETYLYRIGKAIDYINTYGSGEEIELYVGFPSYDFKATHAGYQRQLAKLYQAGVSKILITAYQRFPNFGYMNGNYADGATYTGTFTAGSNIITNVQAWGYLGGASLSGSAIPGGTFLGLLGTNSITMVNSLNLPANATASGVRKFTVSQGLPSGGYRRITDDICSDGVSRDIGVILSMESATVNNNNTCPGGTETDFNFSGYIMQGMSVTPHSSGTDFRAIDSGGLTQTCNCCVTPVLTAPPITYNPLSMDEIWQYIAEVPPSGGICPACYPTQTVDTFNEEIATDPGGVLDNYINFDTLIVFDQEFMRQLDITPAIALDSSISGTDSTCNGVDDGTATVGVTGGVSPYTYQWEVFSGGFWINYVGTGATTNTITGLVPGIYRCEVTDAAATVATSNSEIVSEPAVIDFTVVSTTANCAGTGGSISITGVTGGTTPYLYSIVLTGSPKVWTGATSRNGLVTGTYDVSVASGDPADGCFVTKTGTITTGSSFTITATQGNAGCYLGTGSLTTTPSVAGTYTYDLYDSAPTLIQSNSSGVFNNLVAGAYTIQATNSLGCSSNILSKTITQPTAVTVSTVEIIAPDCYGNANGSIEVSASGGTGPYSYTIIYPTTNVVSNSSGIFVNLPSGQYTVYAEDAQGCTSSLVFLTVPVTAQIQADYQVTQPRTGESTTGSIILESISGGSEPIEYLWSNAATSSSLSDVPTGDYTVIITDNNGCNITKTFTIRLECPTFTLEEMKILAYKAQCCAGDLAVKYINNIREGREDLAKCKLDDLRALTMIIDTLYCTQDPGAEACLSCEDMQNLMTQINNLCDCDCCKDPNYQTIDVTYDSSTGSINQI